MSLRFYCAYCTASFSQFKELVEHFEAQHSQGEVKTLEEKQSRYLTDERSYGGADSGCEEATEFLGYQSSCLNCPFKKCVLEEKGVGLATQKKRRRNEEIRSRFKAGAKIKDLVVEYGVSRRTVERVVVKGKGSRR